MVIEGFNMSTKTIYSIRVLVELRKMMEEMKEINWQEEIRRMVVEPVKNKSKERLLAEAKEIRKDMKAEVANVAWKRVVFFNGSKEIALKALRRGIDFIISLCELISSEKLLEDAFEIAIADKIIICNSLFIAASEREKVPLITTDEKLYEQVKSKRSVKLI